MKLLISIMMALITSSAFADRLLVIEPVSDEIIERSPAGKSSRCT